RYECRIGIRRCKPRPGSGGALVGLRAVRSAPAPAIAQPGAARHHSRSVMDLWTAFQTVLLGIVEGLTEFLPISSTGHQIIVANLIGFGGERFKAFNIIIQLGAILAVVWEYRRKITDVVVGLPR